MFLIYKAVQVSPPLILEKFHCRQKEALYHEQSTPIFPRSAPSPFMGLGKHNFLSLCLTWTFHVNGITQYVAFCAWLLLLSIVFSRFIHVAAHRSTVFPIMLHVYGFTTFCLRNLIIIYYLLFIQQIFTKSLQCPR